MTVGIARPLSFAKRFLLTGTAVLAIAAPLTLGMLNAPPARAQSPVGFEVASIKPNTTADLRGTRMFTLPGGRLTITNTPLFMIIAAAYQIPFQSMRISGGPEWIRSERYDIDAVAAPGSIPPGLSQRARYDRMMPMLQKLLTDRFALAVQHDTEEVPAYAVLVAKSGLKLQKSKIDEKDCPDQPAQGTLGCHNFLGGVGRGMTAEAVTIGDIASWVENWADRPVVDKSGITGLYALKTDGWVPMRPTPPRQTGANAPPGPGVAEDLTDPFRPTLFTVFDQMGLKLEAQKLPVDAYVIEKVERPSQN